jgi:hypothetical protein
MAGMKLTRKFFQDAGRRGGIIGGALAAKNMTAEQRSQRARKAAVARHAKNSENSGK